MEKKLASSPSKEDPTTDLRDAIQKLEIFALQNESEPIPHVGHFEDNSLIPVTKTPLQRTIDLARCFIAATFSDKAREENDKKRFIIHDELLQAIDVVKSQYLLIEKLKKGNPSEQKLASCATLTIQRYNAIIDQAKRIPTSLRERMVRLAYQHSGLSLEEGLNKIDLPQTAEIELGSPLKNRFETVSNKMFRDRFHSHFLPSSSKKIASLMQQREISNDEAISKREADAFRMKAISLLNHHGIPFSSVSDALNSIRTAPIHVHPSIENAFPFSVLSLFQTLTPFPGEIIELQGSFKRDPKSRERSIPIPESFHLFSKSIQTGFPHPSQHTGWALADQLIPLCPHRLDQLPLFVSLYQRKKETAQALLPQGRLINIAKNLHKLKKEAFQKNADNFIHLHGNFIKAIVKSAPLEIIPGGTERAVDQFYQILKHHPCSFHLLTETNQAIIEHFIAQPYKKLQEVWLERSHPNLANKDPQKSCQGALEILCQEINLNASQKIAIQFDQSDDSFIQNTLEYILCIGKLIGKSSCAIILQQLSEGMGLAPPMLTEFEQKVQCSVYKQLQEFIDQLNAYTSLKDMNDIGTVLQRQIESDTAIFESPSCDEIIAPSLEIVQELEVYFNSRYYYQLNRV